MKVFELIAKLQQCDPQANVYHQWYETNETGTTWDTGDAVNEVGQFSGAFEPRRRAGADERHVVLK